LLRVKSESDANELFNKLKEFKDSDSS